MNPSDTGPTISPRREKLFAALSLILGTAMALMFAEWGLDIYFQRIQCQTMDPGLIRYHSQLGWALSPGWTGQHTHHDYHSIYNIGPDGFRIQSEGTVDGDARQYAVLGDSFTFGFGVEDEQTFVSQLNAMGVNTFRNYGIPGTSTDQQLLLLRQIIPDDSSVGVMLVVYLANDLLDNTLPYPLQAEQAKPFFRLENGRLELSNSPVPLVPKPALLRSTTLSSVVLEGFTIQDSAFAGTSLGRLVTTIASDRQYDEDELRPVLERNLTPALELFAVLLDDIAQEIAQSGSGLTVVLLPGRDAMVNPNGVSHHYQEYLRQSVMALLERRSIDNVDLMAVMATESEADIRLMYYPNDGHLTPEGHRYVAAKLAQTFN
ncbi:MAG: SGNH/GDSL hydrolase family protein [Gammaproteobacteria bacterium]|nr:SGNH/GDSL hydrolase family protein [Gammaproteobacteria bacterium]